MDTAECLFSDIVSLDIVHNKNLESITITFELWSRLIFSAREKIEKNHEREVGLSLCMKKLETKQKTKLMAFEMESDTEVQNVFLKEERVCTQYGTRIEIVFSSLQSNNRYNVNEKETLHVCIFVIVYSDQA